VPQGDADEKHAQNIAEVIKEKSWHKTQGSRVKSREAQAGQGGRRIGKLKTIKNYERETSAETSGR
jgi:hypothetical protein